MYTNYLPFTSRISKMNNDSVRAFIVGNDLLIWNVFSSLHQTVREELNLDNKAIPIVLYGMMGKECFVDVTDNTKNTIWYHNSDVADAIEENLFMKRNFSHIDVDYFDSAIVGDWKDISDDDR